MKQKFNVITSSCIPLPLENVDTDQIIPARFLKAIDKEGMGDNLFRDWRYNADGTPKPDFVMNDPSYSGVILVAGKNFGSGSSREHAVWALRDYGFKELFESIDKDHKTEVKVDLPNQTVTNLATGKSEHFEINGYKKHCWENGLDDVDFLVQNRDKVEVWEAQNK